MCMYIGTLHEITFVDVMPIKKGSLSEGTHREIWSVKHIHAKIPFSLCSFSTTFSLYSAFE